MNNIEENFKFEENKSNLKISFERISFIFFIFFIITVIFASKTIYLGFKKNNQNQTIKEIKKKRDIEHLSWIEMVILLPKQYA